MYNLNIYIAYATLIEPDGQVAMYRQRGLGSLTSIQQDMLVNRGLLHKDWKKVKELSVEMLSIPISLFNLDSVNTLLFISEYSTLS